MPSGSSDSRIDQALCLKCERRFNTKDEAINHSDEYGHNVLTVEIVRTTWRPNR